MQQIDLAFRLDETTAQLQQHLRTVRSCSLMLTLLGTVPNNSQPDDTISGDPLDRMIASLCGTKRDTKQPSLAEVVMQESNLYRLRVTKGKQKIREIVLGKTPEQRLQNIVDAAVAAARIERNRSCRPMTERLQPLVDVIGELRTVLPDMISPNFNLADAAELCHKQPATPQRHRPNNSPAAAPA